MTCDHCRSSNTTTIRLELDGGKFLELFTCHFCSWRLWRSESKTLKLPEVLELTASSRPH